MRPVGVSTAATCLCLAAQIAASTMAMVPVGAQGAFNAQMMMVYPGMQPGCQHRHKKCKKHHKKKKKKDDDESSSSSDSDSDFETEYYLVQNGSRGPYTCKCIGDWFRTFTVQLLRPRRNVFVSGGGVQICTNLIQSCS